MTEVDEARRRSASMPFPKLGWRNDDHLGTDTCIRKAHEHGLGCQARLLQVGDPEGEGPCECPQNPATGLSGGRLALADAGQRGRSLCEAQPGVEPAEGRHQLLGEALPGLCVGQDRRVLVQQEDRQGVLLDQGVPGLARGFQQPFVLVEQPGRHVGAATEEAGKHGPWPGHGPDHDSPGTVTRAHRGQDDALGGLFRDPVGAGTNPGAVGVLSRDRRPGDHGHLRGRQGQRNGGVVGPVPALRARRDIELPPHRSHDVAGGDRGSILESLPGRQVDSAVIVPRAGECVRVESGQRQRHQVDDRGRVAVSGDAEEGSPPAAGERPRPTGDWRSGVWPRCRRRG